MADFASSEADLQHNDGFYGSLFENLPYGCAYCRMLYKDGKPDDFIYLAVNEAFGTLTGLRDIVGQKVTEIIPNIQETDFQLIETYGRVARGGKPEQFEFFHNALKEWILISVYCPKQDHFVAVFDVITERKQAGMALQKIYSEMQHLLNISAAGLARLNRNQIFLSANSAYAKLAGMPLEQIIGNSAVEVIGKKRYAAVMPYIERVLNGERVEYEVNIPFKYSDVEYLHVVFTPDKDDHGNIVGWVSSVTDITERKQAEMELLLKDHQLANSERFLKAIIESEPECIKLLDTDGNLLMMNRAGLDMFDADSLDQVKGHCVYPLIAEPYRDAFMTLTKEVFKGESGTFEFETIGLKGRHVWLETHAVPFRNEQGEITALLGISRDITERKKLEKDRIILEKQFQEAQKMESLGVLAGGIAHDFNNLLAVIIGHCSLAKLKPITAVDNIPQIETAAERAAELCQQMLAYAGKSNITKSRIHLKNLVIEMINMSRSTIGQNVKINSNISTDIPLIMADASQVRQITMNLIINAAEAIGESQGEVRVSLNKTIIRADQQEKDHLGSIIPSRTYVCLEVTDNGCGMDTETQRRIFEPFYTTKFTGRGLGMSAVLGIIKSHNGALQLYSQPAKGTKFKVYLPVQITESAEDQSHHHDSLPTPWKGNGTVLLVEDEKQVICIAEAMLEVLGFTVIKAYDGKEGLELYQQNSKNIKLVVTDIGMPIMDGYALISELKKLKPGLPIIITSGYGEADVTSRISHEKICGIINKPYNFMQFRDVLQRVVEGTPLIIHD